MTARITASALAGVLISAAGTSPLFAGDFGISFHYSRYSTSSPRCYTAYAPRSFVYYADYPRDCVYRDRGYDRRCYDTSYDYCDPLVYVERSTPGALICDTGYPTTYRTTYSRSDYFTRPVRHSRTAVVCRSGQRSYHQRRQVITHQRRSEPRVRIHTYKRSSTPCDRYSRSHPRPSVRLYTDRSDSRYRYGDVRRSSSHDRLRSLRSGHSSSHDRSRASRHGHRNSHDRSQRRVRTLRR
jgi:hypothetical protein